MSGRGYGVKEGQRYRGSVPGTQAQPALTRARRQRYTPSAVASEDRARVRRWSFRLVLVGSLLLAGGLAWDIALHAVDPDLTAYEGLAATFAPPHLMLAAGSVLTTVGVMLSM